MRDLAVGVREREEQIRDMEDISLSLLTGRQHVRLAWHATSANVVKMEVKLLSADIVVDVILRVII